MKFDNVYKKYAHIFACDEVGRGPLAGPVVSCSIHIDNRDPVKFIKWLNFLIDIGVQDSKKVSEKKRSDILQQVFKQDHFVAKKIYQAKELVTLSATIIEIDAPVIDEINILQASLQAMRNGTEQLFDLIPEKKDSAICLIDGNQCFKSIDAALELAPIIIRIGR
jgi:ribonuclease HII